MRFSSLTFDLYTDMLCVEFLRNAISEFPSEWQLQYRLADALTAMGYQKYNAHAIPAEGCDDIRNDTETAYKEKMAHSQSPVRISGEAILTLMHQLFRVIYLMKNRSLTTLDTFLAVVRLYESIIDDGNFGICHNDMCMLYLRCSSAAIHLNDSKRALNYLEVALDHFIQFKQVMEMPRMPQLTEPLVSKAKSCVTDIFALNRKLFEDHMQAFPAECVDAIRNNPKYASIFAD